MQASIEPFYQDMMFYDGICVLDDRIWMISAGKNLLTEIDLYTGELLKCQWIPCKNHAILPYRFLEIVNNKLCLIPYDESSICFYDPNSDEFEFVDIPKDFFEENDTCRFGGCCVIENKIFFYGIYSKILVLEIIDGDYSFSWFDLKEYKPEMLVIKSWFWGKCYYDSGIISLVIRELPYIVTIDCDGYKVGFEKIVGEHDALVNAFYEGEFLIYTSREACGTIKKYNVREKTCNVVYATESNNSIERYFGYIYGNKDRIVVLAGQNDKSFFVEQQYEKVIEYHNLSKYKKLGKGFPHELIYRNAFLSFNKHIIAINSWERTIVDIDFGTENIRTTDIKVSNLLDKNKLFKSVINGKKETVLQESAEGMLEAFLDVVKDSI